MSATLTFQNGSPVESGDTIYSRIGGTPYTFDRIHTFPDANGHGGMLSVRERDGRKSTIAAESFSVAWRQDDAPQVHTFDSTRDTYNASQCRDNIRDGDVLLVPSEGAAAVVVSAWPTAPDRKTAGEVFHVLGVGVEWNAVPNLSGGSDDYSASAAVLRSELAKLRATDPDNVTERQSLARLIEDATGDDYVTTTEAAAVVQWVREWIADVTDSDPRDYGIVSDAVYLRAAQRDIDGGLAFVLADVRRCAEHNEYMWADASFPITTTDKTDASALTLSLSLPSGYVLDGLVYMASSRVGRFKLRHVESGHGVHLAPTLDLSRESSQYEVGRILAAHGCDLPRNASSYMIKGYAAFEDERLASLHDPCDCGTVKGESGGYVPHDIGGHPDCTGTDDSANDKPRPTDHNFGCPRSEVWDGEDGCRCFDPVPDPAADTAAARIADDAAKDYAYDPDVEDAESAAMRAVDIAADASLEGAAILAAQIFGSGDDIRECEAEKDRAWRALSDTGDDTYLPMWRNAIERVRAVKGSPDVAYVLVTSYPDACAALLAKLGAEGDTCSDAYKLGREALAAVDAIEPFTYGAYPLDGRRGDLERMRADAARYCADAIRDAAWNVRYAEDAQDIEVGMPRAE